MLEKVSGRTDKFITISSGINYSSPPPPEPFCCHETDHCEGCPYPSTGFICRHKDGGCMRTDEKKCRGKEMQR